MLPMLNNKYRYLYKTPLTLLYNLALSLVAFTICRIIFLAANISYFPNLTNVQLFSLFKGGVIFDISAIVYLNILYILLMATPIYFKEKERYQRYAKWLFVFTNGIAVVANLIDVVYFRYTDHRTTASTFKEFSNEGNIGTIIEKGMVANWYLTIVGILLIFALWKLYKTSGLNQRPQKLRPYYIAQTMLLLLISTFCVIGMRGGVIYHSRPISNTDANVYISRPSEASIVLNTPFSIIRTIGEKHYIDPKYYSSDKELNAIFNPILQTNDSVTPKKLNVVVLIMESFSKEFVGSMNPHLDGGKYKGYTPFLDSLIQHSLTFNHSFANGQKSIDAMPSILSGLPKLYECYFLTPYALNSISGIAGELRKEGYYSAFFHGATNGSMGFEGFANMSGFQDYYGMTEYNNNKDFDGTWAIWDEEFFQFYAKKMSSFRQPFVTTLFSATSHNPFVIPEKYEGRFPEGTMPIHKCIGYSDYSLKRFFETASKQPWFNNTLFVLTADHVNQPYHAEYKADCGKFEVPIIFFRPGNKLKGKVETIAEQIDIMPSVLGYLGYKKPFMSFGRDLFHSKPEDGYAVSYVNNTFQYMKGKYMIQFDGQKTISVYNFVNDPLLKQNLLGRVPEQAAMEKELKAIIQQYVERLINDRLTAKGN